MKGSALEKIARWLGTRSTATLSKYGFMVFCALLIMGGIWGTISEERHKQTIEQHLENYADSNKAFAESRLPPEFICTTDSRGVPLGYEMITNGLEYDFIIRGMSIPFGFPRDTYESAIEHAQDICRIRTEEEYRETTKWVKILN